MTTTDSLLRSLNHALILRHVRDGFHLLDSADLPNHLADPTAPNAATLLFCVAQWVDLGYQDIPFLRGLTAPFLRVPAGPMQLHDYLCLRMVEAYLAFINEESAKACEIFDLVLRIGVDVLEPHLVVVAHFWKCRAHRQQGQYDLALHHIQRAKTLSLQMEAFRLVAVTNIQESWLLFQRGQRREALRLLDEAEAELKSTGHVLSLGNIESARGRFVRRGGEYTKALDHFERAAQIYRSQFPQHPNLARALVNAAYVKRLIALELQGPSGAGRARGSHHSRFMQMCQDALNLLRQAGEIYTHTHHQTGTGTVLVNAAYLHLDMGDIDQAEQEATKAYELGDQKLDHILMGRARTLLAAIHNERAEEQLGELHDTARSAHLARSYAEDAVSLAKLTQNSRLLAGAYIISGTVAANTFFADWHAAKSFASLATEHLSMEDSDHLSKQLRHLKQSILQAKGVDEILRSWSEGIVGEKTFQQVTNEFAEMVIPKVWEREGRKISRVAEVLSISPKKVRRILINARGTSME